MRVPPWPIVGVVLGHDPNSDAMTVTFPSLQMPGLSVRRTYHGAADTMRINKPPLPTRGTHGLVVFPHGDLRSPVWIGSIQQNLADAIPSDANDPFMHYESHFSGAWHLLDMFGNLAHQFADGSTLVSNVSGGALPTTYRHIVDQNQEQQRQPLTWSQRNPTPPPPFTHAFTQATSGSAGGCSVTVSSSGSLSVSSAVTGQLVTITYNGATVQIDGSGNINLTPSGGGNVVVTGNVHVTGNVTAGYGGGDSVTLQNHLHSGVTTGSSNTQKPNAGT